MPKTLLLMRHGKGDKKVEGLNERGIQQVRQAADYMIEKGYQLQLIIHSPLLKASHSAELVQKKFKEAKPEMTIPLQESHDLLASDLSRAVSELDGCHDTVLMVSHGPEIEETLKNLASAPSERIQNGEIVVINNPDNEWRVMAASSTNKINSSFIPKLQF